eukprot:13038305-Alexandrium_andersonii.AAC.1
MDVWTAAQLLSAGGLGGYRPPLPPQLLAAPQQLGLPSGSGVGGGGPGWACNNYTLARSSLGK